VLAFGGNVLPHQRGLGVGGVRHGKGQDTAMRQSLEFRGWRLGRGGDGGGGVKPLLFLQDFRGWALEGPQGRGKPFAGRS
jgi:hypothetical protein